MCGNAFELVGDVHNKTLVYVICVKFLLETCMVKSCLRLSVCGNAFEPLETFVHSSSVCQCVGTLLNH